MRSGGPSRAGWGHWADIRATCEKNPRAVERILRRRVRRSYNCPGLRTAAPGASHFYGAAVTLAHMAQLCGQLFVHRDRLGQSSSSHALCHRGHFTSDVVQFCASVFGVAASPFNRLDVVWEEETSIKRARY